MRCTSIFPTAMAVAAVALCVACSGVPQRQTEGPGLSFNHSLGEGHQEHHQGPKSQPRAPKPAASTAARPDTKAKSEKRAHNEVPDPEPLELGTQWEYHLAYDAGEVRVTSIDQKTFKHAVTTARRYGRFAIELWIGHELIDRVRFDFPLVRPESETSSPGTAQTPISISAGAHSEQTVLVPASPRATRAVLVDSSNDEVRELDWPPDRPMGPNTSVD